MRTFRFLAVLLLLLPGAPAGFESPSEAVLVGEVRDGRGPVAGARVRFKGKAEAVLTDADGHFQLPLRHGTSERVTAWKEDYFIAGAAADTLPLVLRLTPLPDDDHPDYEWIDPTPDASSKQHNCGNCHGEIYREWRASGHSRAAAGRRFRNLYEGSDAGGKPDVGWNLLAEREDAAGVCTACHAPTVGFQDPPYFDLRLVKGVPAQGVHCDYCHKVAEAPTDNLGRTHGRFGLLLRRPREGLLFFGPLDDVDRGEDAFLPLYRESRYCASCHEGTVLGVPVYTTYSEWLESPARRAGQQCQTCHMAPTGKLTNLAPGKGGIERDPKTLGNHRFFAGSQADMLRKCLKASVHLQRTGGELRVEVEVRAEDVGHRVPTGFADRHVVLVVEALDEAGRRLAARSGPVLPPAVGAELAGSPGRLYVKLLSDFDGRGPVPFWRAQTAVADSRLTPARPDRSVYVLPPETARLRLRLIHRKFWQQVADQKGWTGNEISVLDQLIPVGPGVETRWQSD